MTQVYCILVQRSEIDFMMNNKNDLKHEKTICEDVPIIRMCKQNTRRLVVFIVFFVSSQNSTVSQDERQTIVENACPGPGACGGMYTANTMASAIEVQQSSLYSAGMRQPTLPALIQRQPVLFTPHTATLLIVNSICAKRFHRH